MALPGPAAALLSALAIRLVAAGAAAGMLRRPAAARRVTFAAATAASILTGLAAARILLSGAPVSGVLIVHRASAFAFTYTIDPLAAWFLLVLSATAAPIAIFSIGYAADPHLEGRSPFIGAAFNLLIAAIEIVFVAADAVTFLFAWELMTLATAALVATDHQEADSRRAAYLYLVMSHVGTGCLFAGFLKLASAAGSTSFAAMLSGTLAQGAGRDWLFALFFVGFGVKAGIIPLHVWLPEAHPAAPTNISALMSAVLLKAGIYGIVRVCAFGLGVPRLSWGVLVLAIGGISAVLGVLYALMQHDLKRLLAYHSIENIGIILLGLGTGMIALAYGRTDVAWIGVAASLYHVLNHAIFKGLLFLGAGDVVMTTGTRQIEMYGGLLRRMPWTGLLFLAGAMAISGLPPLNGFASEWLTFQGFLYGFRGGSQPLVHFLFAVGGALLALVTALAAACFVKAFAITFLALPRSDAAAGAREAPAIMLVPQVWLAALCVALGIFPGAVLQVLDRVLMSLPGLPHQPDVFRGRLAMTTGGGSFDRVTPLVLTLVMAAGVIAAVFMTRSRVAVRRAPTWGCGGELSARTEYTATAFSKPLMMIFRAVYRPTRQVEALGDSARYFPKEVRYHAEIEPTFERYVYGPLVRWVLRVADGMKVLQAGSLHAYLAYVIALVVWLVLRVWLNA
jgi:hydrogenase-4 component B